MPKDPPATRRLKKSGGDPGSPGMARAVNKSANKYKWSEESKTRYGTTMAEETKASNDAMAPMMAARRKYEQSKRKK